MFFINKWNNRKLGKKMNKIKWWENNIIKEVRDY